MAGLHLYEFPFSQPSRSVAMLLKAASIDYENHVLNIFAGTSLSRNSLILNR
jgi:glutathione S-transferase